MYIEVREGLWRCARSPAAAAGFLVCLGPLVALVVEAAVSLVAASLPCWLLLLLYCLPGWLLLGQLLPLLLLCLGWLLLVFLGLGCCAAGPLLCHALLLPWWLGLLCCCCWALLCSCGFSQKMLYHCPMQWRIHWSMWSHWRCHCDWRSQELSRWHHGCRGQQRWSCWLQQWCWMHQWCGCGRQQLGRRRPKWQTRSIQNWRHQWHRWRHRPVAWTGPRKPWHILHGLRLGLGPCIWSRVWDDGLVGHGACRLHGIARRTVWSNGPVVVVVHGGTGKSAPRALAYAYVVHRLSSRV